MKDIGKLFQTHSPPHGILDEVYNNGVHLGSPSLYNEIIDRIKCDVHCFGHIHSAHGTKKINNTLFVNASNLNEKYEVCYNPIIIELNDNNEYIVSNENDHSIFVYH